MSELAASGSRGIYHPFIFKDPVHCPATPPPPLPISHLYDPVFKLRPKPISSLVGGKKKQGAQCCHDTTILGKASVKKK